MDGIAPPFDLLFTNFTLCRRLLRLNNWSEESSLKSAVSKCTEQSREYLVGTKSFRAMFFSHAV